MVETNVVREKYASMPDSELIALATEEGIQLTTEGFELLKNEFVKRGLDEGIIENIEAGKISAASDYLQIKDDPDPFTITSWSYAFEQKEYGKNNPEIIAGLIERGLEESQAVQLVSNMETMAKQRLKKAELEKLTGGLIFISGVSINFLPLSVTSNRLAYIMAGCIILFGAARYIKGTYYKSSFKKIIANIARENNA